MKRSPSLPAARTVGAGRQAAAERPADACRRLGWTVGTRLAGADDGHGPIVIRITAIGETDILGVLESHRGEPVQGSRECRWTLALRDWWVAASAPPAALSLRRTS